MPQVIARPYSTKFSCFSQELQLGVWMLNKVTPCLCFLHEGGLGENGNSEQARWWEQLVSIPPSSPRVCPPWYKSSTGKNEGLSSVQKKQQIIVHPNFLLFNASGFS